LYLESLSLKHFRSYDTLKTQFSPTSNLIIGKNGAGKSNILEAVYLLSTSKSFRNAIDQRMVKWGEDGFHVKGQFSTENGRRDISIVYSGGSKSLEIDGLKEGRIANIIGMVYCILFSFEDIHIVTGPPIVRRNLLDLILSTSDPLYFRNLKTYVNVIRQKNRYLKENRRIDEDILYAWNEQLVPAGSYLISKRDTLIDFMNRCIGSLVESLGENLIFPFQLSYRTNVTRGESVREPEQAYRSTLEKRIDKEIQLQSSLYGPHRDDFCFIEKMHEIRYFGSVGESRLATILLKLAQEEFYRKEKGIMPILLMDDILLELDSKNAERVLKLFPSNGQRIITTTERKKLPEIFSCDRMFNVDKKCNDSVLQFSDN
jgi:DNA replication and repair protein RecF